MLKLTSHFGKENFLTIFCEIVCSKSPREGDNRVEGMLRFRAHEMKIARDRVSCQVPKSPLQNGFEFSCKRVWSSEFHEVPESWTLPSPSIVGYGEGLEIFLGPEELHR